MLVVGVGDGRMMEIVVRMCGWMVINDLIGMGVNVSGDNLSEKKFEDWTDPCPEVLHQVGDWVPYFYC